MNVTMCVTYKTPEGEHETLDVTEMSLVDNSHRTLQALQVLADELDLQFRVELFIRKGRDC